MERTRQGINSQKQVNKRLVGKKAGRWFGVTDGSPGMLARDQTSFSAVRVLEVSAQSWVSVRRKEVSWEEEGVAGDRLETAVVQAGDDGD